MFLSETMQNSVRCGHRFGHRYSQIGVIAYVAITLTIATTSAAESTQNTHRAHRSGWASSYGPGLFGNRTACGQTLTRRTRGIAHRSWRCGSRVRVCYRRRCTVTRVIDRGPYVYSRSLDLTARTTRDLCRCSPHVWGVRRVAYRRVTR